MPTAVPATATTAVTPQEPLFTAPSRFRQHVLQVETSESVSIAAAYLDGDGHVDLVLSGDPLVTILFGDGSGGFDRRIRAPGGPQPVDFALADIDEDADTDIVIANHDTDHLSLLLNDGVGGFTPAPNSPLTVAVSPHPHAVRAADLEADGLPDLVVDHRDAGGVLVLRGLGGGIFEQPGVLVPVGGDPYRGMALGDIDGDGRPDLVTPNPNDAGILINTSRDGISFEHAEAVPARAPFAVALADFDGDGRLDLVSGANERLSVVEVFLGAGNGRFSTHPDSPFEFAAGGKHIASGDFNADGLADAVIACWQSLEVMVLWGGRDGLQTTLLPGGEHPWGLAAVDLNDDGMDDIVIADDTTPQVFIYVSTGR